MASSLGVFVVYKNKEGGIGIYPGMSAEEVIAELDREEIQFERLLSLETLGEYLT